jgi:MSHA biogenesis protein MshJ
MTLLADLRARHARMTRRERAIVAIAGALGILLIGYVLAVEPALKRRALLERQIMSQRAERDAIRAALAPGVRDPDVAMRTQLEALEAQLRTTDRDFGQIQNGLVQPQHMGALLQSLLTEHRGLKLLGLRTLPVVAAGDPSGEARKTTAAPAANAASANATSANAASASADDAWLFRHGVEIRVQGTYADMTAYLQAIESLPRRVHWGALEIDARRYPASVMTVTIYTVSLERSWWVL